MTSRFTRAQTNRLLLLTALALGLLAAVWAGTLWRINYSRSEAISEATGHGEDLARMFAERTRSLVREIDQAAYFLKYEFEQRDARGERLDLAEFARRPGLLPTDVTLRISIVDEKGDVIASNQPFKPANVSDRDYFKAQSTATSDDLLISRPLLGRASPRMVVAYSRRLTHADGTFAGVIVLAVDPAYFTAVYEKSALMARGFVGLLGTDGVLRAARIGDKELLNEAESVVPVGEWASASQAGTAQLVSPFDGMKRIFSYQRVVGFPLIAITGVAEDDALAGFQPQRQIYLLAAAIASAVVVGLATLLMFQGFRLQVSQRRDREGVERLRLITDNMPTLISYLDAEQRIRFINRTYKDWLGLEPGTVIGRSLLDVYGAEVYAEIRPHIEAALTGRSLMYERELITLSGKRQVGVTLIPHCDDQGNVVGLYVMTTDLTVQRAMMRSAKQQDEVIALGRRRGLEQGHALVLAREATEAAEKANRAKSAFLATMSHEIRTPMNGVVGMADVLAESSLTHDQADAVATIRTSALSLLGTINDILDFSKIEAGALELERCIVALTELVAGVCDSLRPLAAAKGVALAVSIDASAPAYGWGDPTRLRQVLYNLIGNAIKFSAGRSSLPGSVDVRVGGSSTTPSTVTFTVADNGIGISAEALAKLFKPFVQAEHSTTRRFGGTGLGLVICKRLVALMGGDISVQSEPGTGSTFAATFPFERARGPNRPRTRVSADALGGTANDGYHDSDERLDSDATAIAGNAAAVAPDDGAGPGCGVILVAEDDEISQKVIRRQLSLLGYSAEVVDDGTQALRLWRAGKYALLLTDLHMPEMDGYTLTETIRRDELEQGCATSDRIPIIALTANALREEGAKVRMVGMDDYLTKPIQLGVLRSALETWLPGPH